MELNIRTWNMNYWKVRKGIVAKTGEEKIKWVEYAKDSIVKNNLYDFFLLQETSLNMFSGENVEFGHIDDDNSIHVDYTFNDVRKKIIYNSNPKKYLSWGNMIISECKKNDYSYLIPVKGNNSRLAYQCCIFQKEKPISFINVHLQKDHGTSMYYPSLMELINEIKTIKNDPLMHDGPIILVGDFNASDKFNSSELDNFKKAFLEIREMGFIDCTESIDLNKRSTMLDYEYQNDYVFVNEPYYKNIKNLVIRKDIESEYIDHYPIDFKIEV
jgi:endonuclease/exonuclease/phosphatase family metal-dependent hydrolase